ncbi:hypothetical protein BT63DRAFT_441096 [Microthyrium microscopicum]|uniref:PEX11 domain protein n=1 Tax=Microthyrium microscopicum TaxID=703497 RepID=A0A6A6U5L2_9PEZI|nr:hypothetical protein BT63DRAFT_441096 [Microthyrium microscopicum]
MFTSLSRFVNNAAGLEKTLRIAQSLLLINVSLSLAATGKSSWSLALSHIAVSRRFFRLLRWVDCWANAEATFNDQKSNTLHRVVATAKWSLLGIYFFLEMFAITNVLGATTYSWGRPLEIEANKFWVYGLGASIILSLVDLATLPSAPVPNKETVQALNEKGDKNKTTVPEKKEISASPGTNSQNLMKQLVIDTCDLATPGTLIGWIQIDRAYVGAAMFVSSLLAATDIWRNVQAASVPQRALATKGKK